MQPLRISKLLFPRLTVLVTTCNRHGRPNVATFSFIMPVSFRPPCLALAVAPSRLTFANISQVGEFVVNVPTASMLEKVWLCGRVSGKKADKFKLAGLTPVPSIKVKPPRIRECPVQLECEVETEVECGDHCLVVGRVVAQHVESTEFEPLLHYSGPVFYSPGRKLEAK